MDYEAACHIQEELAAARAIGDVGDLLAAAAAHRTAIEEPLTAERRMRGTQRGELPSELQ